MLYCNSDAEVIFVQHVIDASGKAHNVGKCLDNELQASLRRGAQRTVFGFTCFTEFASFTFKLLTL
jgi:hypothetical protein